MQACTRQLVTADLDLRDATYVQFYFRYGCGRASPRPSSRDEGVVVQFSETGGTEWTNLLRLYFDQYANATCVQERCRFDFRRFRFFFFLLNIAIACYVHACVVWYACVCVRVCVYGLLPDSNKD